MLLSTSVTLLGLCLVAQAPPNSGAAGSTSVAGVKSGGSASGAAVKKAGHDLADILAPLADRATRRDPASPPSPPDGGDVQVSSPNARQQFRPSLVVDPTDRLHLFGSATDLRHSAQHSAFYASFDGGRTWSETLRGSSYDPSIAFGEGGEIYLATTVPSGSPQFRKSDVYVGRSFDGGLTTTNWVKVTDSPANNFSEQSTMATDRSGGPYDGSLYVGYSDGGGEFGHWRVVVVNSRDGGATFAFAAVSEEAALSSVAVGGDGSVDVAYLDGIYGFQYGIMFASSSNGGSSFGTDVKIADAEPFDIPNFRSFAAPRPRIAVDASGGPHDGTIYVTWARSGGSDGPDVVVSASTDQGATWSTPIVASDTTTHSQFSPSIAVDPQGNVVVVFYDARDSSANDAVRLYAARSSDGGATFQPNVAVSDVAFDLDSSDAGLLEECPAVAASDRLVHALWADRRNGDLDVFASSFAPDFATDVETISAATGGTATFTVSPGPLFGSTEYHVLGSLSGTTPGTDFFFESVPVNYDLFTLATIYDANSTVFPGFTGALDASGAATAQLVSGPLPPALIGVQMDFAALVRVNGGVRWGSAPTSVVIGN